MINEGGLSQPVDRLHGADLTLAYGRAAVVHDVSVTLRTGVVTALIGPNGSGKSTVLRSLARLHRPTSGRVEVAGPEGSMADADLLSARAFARRVTLLSQSRPHPSGLKVTDVVTFGRHPHRHRLGAPGAGDRAAVARALDLTGLADMAERPVDELSGGELQRVWLATCLAQDTDVVLLDEPTNHLDLRYQVEILDLVRELADHHRTALGVVLHDLNQAAEVADEVTLLHQGRVWAAGPPAAVLTGPHLSRCTAFRSTSWWTRTPTGPGSNRAPGHAARPASTGARPARRTPDDPHLPPHSGCGCDPCQPHARRLWHDRRRGL